MTRNSVQNVDGNYFLKQHKQESFGLCQCGCGGQTTISTLTDHAKGWIKGQPRSFINHHGGCLRLMNCYVVDVENGCWNWTGKIASHGYGIFRSKYAHRAMYEKLVGVIPTGKLIDHLCRNRRCVNPKHLEIVTQAENLRRAPTVKLTYDDVNLIHQLYRSGISSMDLSKRFGVCQRHIQLIISGGAWVAA
jgi:hypothetical protein